MSASSNINWFRGKYHLERSNEHRFAYPVRSLEELEPALAELAARALLPGETVEEIIIAPRQRYAATRSGRLLERLGLLRWQVSPDCVLLSTQCRLLLLSLPSSQSKTGPQINTGPELVTAPFSSLVSIEMGKILLFSWLEWAWAETGQVQRSRVYFNTVSEDYFARLVNQILLYISGTGHPETGCKNHNLFALGNLPFKFMSFARSSLLPGEAIEAYYFRPAIPEQYDRWFTRRIAPPALFLFTDRHLLWLEEDMTYLNGTYGLITRWIPRWAARQIESQPEGKYAQLLLHTGLAMADQRLGIIVNPEAESGLKTLFQNWIKHAPQEMNRIGRG
jgi:hypothetical protein